METKDREYTLIQRKHSLERLINSLKRDASHPVNQVNRWVPRINSEIRIAEAEVEWIEKEMGW